MRTRPTFWAKQVYGKEFSTPPRVVETPSARIAAVTSFARIRFLTISPVANTSPVVSTMVIIMTMTIMRIAETLNCGMPKKKGVVMPRASARPTSSRWASPSSRATAVPATSPISTDRVPRKPWRKRWTRTMTRSVPAA